MPAKGTIDALELTLSSTTPVQVANGLHPSYGIEFRAADANTGLVYIGGSNVSATKGRPLAATESVFFEMLNVNALYALAAVNGEKLVRTIL